MRKQASKGWKDPGKVFPEEKLPWSHRRNASSGFPLIKTLNETSETVWSQVAEHNTVYIKTKNKKKQGSISV